MGAVKIGGIVLVSYVLIRQRTVPDERRWCERYRLLYHGRRGGQYPGDLQEPLGFLQPRRRLLPVELAKVLHGCSATSPLCTSSLASGTYQAGIRRSRT